MSVSRDAYSFVGQQINVGVSAIVGVTVIASQLGSVLKYSSGGTLWVGVTSGGGWGVGYLMSANEVLSLENSGTLFMVAAGATVVTYMLRTSSST